MIKIQNIISSEKFLIIEGGKFQWQCFGNNARYLDFESNTSCVFDSETGVIFIVDYERDDKFYRYVNPEYMEEYPVGNISVEERKERFYKKNK